MSSLHHGNVVRVTAVSWLNSILVQRSKDVVSQSGLRILRLCSLETFGSEKLQVVIDVDTVRICLPPAEARPEQLEYGTSL
jgi:hypothetical protein